MEKEIIFVTHNTGKIKSAEKYFKNLKFTTFNYELNEPRSDDIKEIATAKELAEKLNATKLTIKHKVGANGHLIGSVTNKEIAESLEDQFSIMLDKKNISLDKKIKSVGIYEVDCKLGHAIHASLKVDIIGE